MQILPFFKKNFLVILLSFIVLLLLFKNSNPISLGSSIDNRNMGVRSMTSDVVSEGKAMMGLAAPEMPPVADFAPQNNVSNRLVIQESYLSILVKDVTSVRNQIIDYALKTGGYMVNSNISNPQDAPTAEVVIRIPADKLEQTLEFLRNAAVKVVSENLNGQDVTDQFVDIDKHIAILEKTKTKYEEILTQAKEISDISNLTQQIINLQNQIDSYKGQQDSLSKQAQLARITIYLSTDEIALPYAPSETFRPEVIFKLAVRSLVSELRKIAAALIWIGVYSVIWLPLLCVVYLIKKYFLKNQVK